ncbi:MAG: SPOR domain-containing protein [Proteobacteria bacterium]|uniref:SPOR domain-containing protein n=1 Tax=Candidatus Enterousia avistercoris TaxID=2840788 RepID=A0A9D9DCG8_9PROT|nr:SPOR domain-containing protein [Candidatus Enterousia avistercoris]
MNKDDNLDLLDLNDDADTMDTLPDAVPFAQPRPKKPWLLLAVGVVVIILATYIIIRTIGGDSTSKMEVDLDGPAIMVEGGDAAVPVQMDVPPQPVNVAPAPQPAPSVAPQPQTPGVPVRVIEDRKDVQFDPHRVDAAPQPAPKPVAAAKPAPKPAPKPVAQAQQPRRDAPANNQNTQKKYAWYAQLGSYSTNAAAESGRRQLQNGHRSLLGGQKFVIQRAVLGNGNTTYRLRVGFNSSGDANNFCRNAKADGLDCYVTK